MQVCFLRSHKQSLIINVSLSLVHVQELIDGNYSISDEIRSEIYKALRGICKRSKFMWKIIKILFGYNQPCKR